MIRRDDERGSATVLLVVAVVLTVAGVSALVDVGSDVVATERAQAVADVTALATAVAGESAGGAVAVGNGGALRGLSRDGPTVIVHVERDGAQATAAAEARADP